MLTVQSMASTKDAKPANYPSQCTIYTLFNSPMSLYLFLSCKTWSSMMLGQSTEDEVSSGSSRQTTCCYAEQKR